MHPITLTDRILDVCTGTDGTNTTRTLTVEVKLDVGCGGAVPIVQNDVYASMMFQEQPWRLKHRVPILLLQLCGCELSAAGSVCVHWHGDGHTVTEQLTAAVQLTFLPQCELCHDAARFVAAIRAYLEKAHALHDSVKKIPSGEPELSVSKVDFLTSRTSPCLMARTQRLHCEVH